MPGMAVRVLDPTGHHICTRIIRVDDCRKPPSTIEVRVPLAAASAGFRHVDDGHEVTAYTPIVAVHEGRDRCRNEIYVCASIERTPAQCSLPV